MLLFVKYSKVRTDKKGAFITWVSRGLERITKFRSHSEPSRLFPSTLPAHLLKETRTFIFLPTLVLPATQLICEGGLRSSGLQCLVESAFPLAFTGLPWGRGLTPLRLVARGSRSFCSPPTSARRLERPELAKWAGHVTVASGGGGRFQAPRTLSALRSVDFSTFASFSVALPVLPYGATCVLGFFAF